MMLRWLLLLHVGIPSQPVRTSSLEVAGLQAIVLYPVKQAVAIK